MFHNVFNTKPIYSTMEHRKCYSITIIHFHAHHWIHQWFITHNGANNLKLIYNIIIPLNHVTQHPNNIHFQWYWILKGNLSLFYQKRAPSYISVTVSLTEAYLVHVKHSMVCASVQQLHITEFYNWPGNTTKITCPLAKSGKYVL